MENILKVLPFPGTNTPSCCLIFMNQFIKIQFYPCSSIRLPDIVSRGISPQTDLYVDKNDESSVCLSAPTHCRYSLLHRQRQRLFFLLKKYCMSKFLSLSALALLLKLYHTKYLLLKLYWWAWTQCHGTKCKKEF